MDRTNFYYLTRQKGKIISGHRITNNSNYLVFYRDHVQVVFVGEVKTKTDAERVINNLIKYQKLTYTPEYK